MADPDVGFSALLWMTVFTFTATFDDVFSYNLGHFHIDKDLISMYIHCIYIMGE